MMSSLSARYLGLIACLLIEPGIANASSTRYINGNWLENDKFVQRTVLVKDGVIVGDNAQRADKTVDLRQAYVIPALAEAHNHNLQNCYLLPQMLKAYASSGILYSAQLFATDPQLEKCGYEFESQRAPSVAFARIGVTSLTGHPIGIARQGAKSAGVEMSFAEITDGMLIADTVEDFAQQWPAMKVRPTDFVKVVLIDAANSKRNAKLPALDGFNGITADVLDAVVRAAKAAQLPVVAHVDTAADFHLAAKAGVDTIAHLPGYRVAAGHSIDDYRLSEAAVQAAAEKGVHVIPTVAASHYFAGSDPAKARTLASNYEQNLRLLQKHRVRILTGSDRFEGSVIDEILALEKTGLFTRSELLNMSAVATAKWIFPKRRVGCLVQGCEASFSVYGKNPLDDLQVLRKPDRVVNRGLEVVPGPQSPKKTD
jgi:imidazolonepropionase-like amidohydrolase